MIGIDIQFFLTILFAIFICFFIHYSLKVYFLRQRYRHIPGPPANGIIGFYFGNALEIKAFQNQGYLLMDKILEWYLKSIFKKILSI